MEVKLVHSDAEILLLFPLMQSLRPHLASANDFLAQVRRQEAQGGFRLIFVENDGEPVALAGFRVAEFLAWGRALYVDDLFASESHRGKGFADALMRWMEEFAAREGCAQFHLDSGTHRLAAHRFYHRFGLSITSFHFSKTLP